MPRLKYYNTKTSQWEYADTGSNIDLTNYATKEYVENSKVAIDTTLQIEGQAADAKAVGEALAQKQTIGDYATITYVTNAISAIPTPDVSGQIGVHNTAIDAHNDIRLLISELTARLNALADSDDITLDQMSEIVAYIKSNKSLIEEVTTNKVNVSDIIDNLTTNVFNKPLSAAQGVALKALVDDITVPTKTSELTNDSGFLTSYTETDPTVPAWAKTAKKPTYTASEIGLTTETWTFTLEDGSTVTKAVYVG